MKDLIQGLMGSITAAVTENFQKGVTEKSPTEDVPNNQEKGHDSRLNEKSYKRMEKFSGGESEWEDWKYDFTIITRSVNPDVGRALEICSRSRKPVSAENLDKLGLTEFSENS